MYTQLSNHRFIAFTFFLFALSLGITSCKSKVEMADVRKQETKAMDELESAREELLKLADMKEQFSVDHRDAQIKALKERQKEIDKDIDRMKSVQTSSAQDDAGNIASSLEKQNKDLSREIKDYEAMTKESWATAKDSINQKIAGLESEVRRITANLRAAEGN